MISTIAGLGGGLLMSVLNLTETTTETLEWWQSLLIAIIPTIIGGIFDIVLSVLKNKKTISEEDAEEIAEKVEENLEKINKTEEDDDDGSESE